MRKKTASVFIILSVILFTSFCSPGDEDPEGGSLHAQVLFLSSLNGSVWNGRPVWNSCTYFPGGASGIFSCLAVENAYSSIYNTCDHNLTVNLALNGAGIAGTVHMLIPDFNLSPFLCEIKVQGYTVYNPDTGINTLSLSQISPCISPSGNKVNLSGLNSQLYSQSMSGNIRLNITDSVSSDRADVIFVFELNKVL